MSDMNDFAKKIADKLRDLHAWAVANTERHADDLFPEQRASQVAAFGEPVGYAIQSPAGEFREVSGKREGWWSHGLEGSVVDSREMADFLSRKSDHECTVRAVYVRSGEASTDG